MKKFIFLFSKLLNTVVGRVNYGEKRVVGDVQELHLKESF
jgi:hypothetical protein